MRKTKLIAYTAIALFTLNNAKAQPCPNPVSIDITNPATYALNKQDYHCHIRYGTPLTIQFINFNKKVYKINEVVALNDFNTEIPAALTGIKLPGFINLSLPAPSVLAQSPSSNVIPEGLQLKGKIAKEEAIKCCSVIKNYIESFGSFCRPNVTDSIVIANQNTLNLKARGEILFQTSLLYNNVLNLSKNCSLTALNIQTSLNSLFSRFLSTYNDGVVPLPLETDRDRFNRTMNIVISRCYADISSIRNESKGILQRIEELLALAEAKPDECKSCELTIELNPFLNELKIAKQNLTSNLESIKSLEDQVRTYEKEDQLNKILFAYDIVNNPANYTYTTVLNNTRADEIIYTFTITPVEQNACNIIPDKTVIEIPIRTYGGVKVDFSTGVFANWGNSDFLGRNYGYEFTTADSSKKKIVSTERGTRALLSIGALAHVYWRSVSFLKPALSFGVSTSTGFDELNFHGGISAIMGNKNRIILTLGTTLRTSKLLGKDQFGNQLEIDKEGASSNFPATIATTNKFPEVGFFAGLTYNFSKFKKSE